jgi:hypothetical protein
MFIDETVENLSEIVRSEAENGRHLPGPDAATIARLFSQLGAALLPRLVGSFSLVIAQLETAGGRVCRARPVDARLGLDI